MIDNERSVTKTNIEYAALQMLAEAEKKTQPHFPRLYEKIQ